MELKGLRRHLPSQGTPRGKKIAQGLLKGQSLKGKLQEPALEQLSTVPEAWLERLEDEGLAYVALGSGEDLSQTELMTSYSPTRLREEAAEARALLADSSEAVDKELKLEMSQETDAFRRGMMEHGKAEMLGERLAEKLDVANLGFKAQVVRGDLSLSVLEGENGIVREDYDEYLEPHETERELFREILLDLNGPGVVSKPGAENERYILADDAVLDPENDLLLIPYRVDNGRRVSPVSKESYSSIDGMSMDQHLGAHYWPNRLIVMDDDVVHLESPKTGFHSVLLHETGHAIDYIAENMPELNHRETVDALYAKDLEKAKSGDNRFTTTRADDNAREYFAEAVEAYLTEEVPSSEHWYKPQNHHAFLKEQNPELYSYVDRLMKS